MTLTAVVRRALTESINARQVGTPVGKTCCTLQAVVSSAHHLVNPFLHHTFDSWVDLHLSSGQFSRDANDWMVHYRSLVQTKFVLAKTGERFGQCGFELHPAKTQIAYCKDINRPEKVSCVQCIFIGYTFRRHKMVGKYGQVYVNFSLAIINMSTRLRNR